MGNMFPRTHPAMQHPKNIRTLNSGSLRFNTQLIFPLIVQSIANKIAQHQQKKIKKNKQISRIIAIWSILKTFVNIQNY